MDLNLRKVRSFVTVAELGSFRRAADKLHISPSALSTHIQQLEASLGIPLLNRTTRSVEITSQGARFLSGSRQLIANLDAIVDDLKGEADTRRTHVTVACVPTLTSIILPAAMAMMSKRYPNTRLSIFDGQGSRIARYVEEGEADFGIGSLPENSQDFVITPLVDDPFVVLVPRDHPFAERRQIRFADLAHYPFIGLKSSFGVRSALDQAARTAGITLSRRFEMVHHYSVGHLVEAGLGITAVPALTVPLVNTPGLISIPLVAPRVTREVNIIRYKGSTLSRSAEQFLSILIATVNDLKSTRGKTGTFSARPEQ